MYLTSVAAEYNGARFSFIYSFSVTSIDGDAWTHIRKGKVVVGYNFEMSLKVSGNIKTAVRYTRHLACVRVLHECVTLLRLSIGCCV